MSHSADELLIGAFVRVYTGLLPDEVSGNLILVLVRPSCAYQRFIHKTEDLVQN